MNEHAVSVTMTKEQLQMISDLIRLGTILGWGSLDEIWRYFPIRLDYDDNEPRDVIAKVKQNFTRVETVSKDVKKLIDTHLVRAPKKQLAVDLKDMQNMISQYFNSINQDGFNFGFEPPAQPLGRFPYIRIDTAL